MQFHLIYCLRQLLEERGIGIYLEMWFEKFRLPSRGRDECVNEGHHDGAVLGLLQVFLDVRQDGLQVVIV
jgi:hypothetical protein